ncbi:MAG: hypothetical protein WC848_02180 [Parcubacteria group bacterium]|jgi:hypothetical protein
MENSEKVRLAELENTVEKMANATIAAFARGLFGATDNGGMYQINLEGDIMVVAKQSWSADCSSGRCGGSTTDYSTRYAIVVDLSGDPCVIGSRYGQCLYRTTHEGVVGSRMPTRLMSARKADGKFFIRFEGEKEFEV